MKKEIIKILKYAWDSIKLLSFDMTIRRENCILVFGAPSHSNMGDQAQSFCIEQWFNRFYPEKKVVIFETGFFNRNAKRLLRQLRKRIKTEDMIVLHSGYHTTDLYMQEENMQRMIIKTFPNKKIIILPQTIYYVSEKEKEKAQTPVLVISSTDHKLKSGVKWFPDSFRPYVKFVENIVDVPAEVSKIYASSYDYKLPEYFNTEYYNTLKEKLEE